MNDDIPESVSQRSSGEETAENRRILEVADELRRRCELYEAQLRNGEEHVSRLEVEQRVAEQYAKDNGMWLPMSDVFNIGVPGPSGNENDMKPIWLLLDSQSKIMKGVSLMRNTRDWSLSRFRII